MIGLLTATLATDSLFSAGSAKDVADTADIAVAIIRMRNILFMAFAW